HKLRLKAFASFSRCAGVTTIVLLLCVSAMAFDDRGSGRPEQSSGQDEINGSAGSSLKSEANGTIPPLFDVSHPSKPNDKDNRTTPIPAMTQKEKFRYFFTRSFLSPITYGTAIASGTFGEWIDNDHHHHSKPGDFAADSMTRAARSFAFGVSANFFEKFAYA